MNMSKKKRSPLDKETFLSGTRQQFTLIFIVCMFLIMAAQIFYSINSGEYLNFLTFIGSMFLGGASLSAYISAKKTNPKEEEIESNIYEAEVTEVVSNSIKPFGKQATGDEKDGPHEN
jgi:hypothetical protein